MLNHIAFIVHVAAVEVGTCYCQVADGIAIAGWWLVDVITSRQMVLPWSFILI